MATLAQLVLLLSSDQPGEVTAAARAIGKTLARDNHDWHWLAGRVNGGEPIDWEARVREAYERGRQSAQHNGARQDVPDDAAFEDCSHAAQWLLDNHGSRLRDKEHDFLETMLDWNGWPTEKQAAWLSSLCRRYGYKP